MKSVKLGVVMKSICFVLLSQGVFAQATTLNAQVLKCSQQSSNSASSSGIVAELTRDEGVLNLKTLSEINSVDGYEEIAAGESLNLNDRSESHGMFWGCFDGTDLSVSQEESADGVLNLKLDVSCMKDPFFEVYRFELQCR